MYKIDPSPKKQQHFCNAVQSPLANNVLFPTFIILKQYYFLLFSFCYIPNTQLCIGGFLFAGE